MTTSNFEHLRTFYLGVKSDELAIPETSEVIRFCMHTFNTYATVLDKLSRAFTRTQLDYQEKYITGPKRISILIPDSIKNHKVKKTDAETSLERLYWFIENFKVPDCGMIISVYASKFQDRELDSHWSLNHVWKTKETWSGKDSKYVTVHLPEMTSNVTWNKEKFPELWDHAKKIIEKNGYEIKYISYETSYEKAYRLLLGTKLHISYVGASMTFTPLTRTPCLALGFKTKENLNSHTVIEGLPFFWRGYPKNIFGSSSGMQQDRVMQLSDETGLIHNDYIHNIISSDMKNDIDECLNNVFDNDYSQFKGHKWGEVTISRDPWYHISIDDFLPKEKFEKLRNEALTVPVKDNEVARKLFKTDPTPEIWKFIYTFLKASDTYNDGNVRYCIPHDLKRFIHFAVTPPNFDHKIHVEAPFKIMSAVLYLGPEENIGTRLYKNPDEKPVKEVEWKPNRLFLFCGNDNTYHDYASTSTRYTYNYFLVDHNIVENEEYKSNLIDAEKP